MINISNINRMKIREVGLIIIYFIFCYFISLNLFPSIDVELVTGVLFSLIYGIIAGLYEVFISVFLKRHFPFAGYLLISFLFYTFLFIVLITSLSISDKTSPVFFFKDFHLNFFFQKNTSVLFFYLTGYLLIQNLLRAIRIRSVRGIPYYYLYGNDSDPFVEKRIMMFIDLKSSTKYAEVLGDKKYSSFIKDIYNKIDESILETKGNLYQYVGDEIVITWSLKNGIKNSNCIRCYFLIEQQMKTLEEFFMTKYGIIPMFNSGVHVGKVVITEIGSVIKKEIAFHGDTVNTTSRICDKCKELELNILISDELYSVLSIKKDNYSYGVVDKYFFKGKKQELELYRVTQNHE